MNILFTILNFAGALAVFLFAMTVMSEGLQKLAGDKMRQILGKITNNPLKGILTGTGVTLAIQSSSATTVMVVSFVNAGLISLAGAVAVIMGANIGTTVTAWIISLFSFGESASLFRLPMLIAAIALLFLFSKREKLKSIGEFVIGLAVLLVGMDLLKAAMPSLADYPRFLEAIGRLSDYGFGSILLFVCVGALLTCVVQSSSAMMAITFVMCYKGWIGYEVAVAMVMGENIGTTITANLASLMANTAGKRAARAHLLFNCIGVCLSLIFFRPAVTLIASVVSGISGADLYAAPGTAGYSPESIPLALSLFHSSFNVLNTCVLAWFIPQIIKVVTWMVPIKAEDAEDEFRLRYIPGNYIKTSELDIQSAQKEIATFSERVLRMYSFLPGLRTARNEEEFKKIVERIEKYEDICDRMEQEITRYLTKISEGVLSAEGSQRISSMLRIIDNLESIGDSIYQIAITRKNKRKDAVHFSQQLNDNLENMTQLVQQALDVMDSNLHEEYVKADIQRAYQAEDAVNTYRDQLRVQHFDALKNGKYDYAIGTTYSTLYALYEKLADYVINVSEAVSGEKKR